MVHFNNDWDEVLAGEFDQEYYKRIRYFLKQEYAEQTVYPPMEYIFNALRLTPYSSVKAVILGQDPYHGPGSSARSVLFRSAGRQGSAQPSEHLQGAQERPRHRAAKGRHAHQMGEAGRSDAQHHAHRPRRTGEQP